MKTLILLFLLTVISFCLAAAAHVAGESPLQNKPNPKP